MYTSSKKRIVSGSFLAINELFVSYLKQPVKFKLNMTRWTINHLLLHKYFSLIGSEIERRVDERNSHHMTASLCNGHLLSVAKVQLRHNEAKPTTVNSINEYSHWENGFHVVEDKTEYGKS